MSLLIDVNHTKVLFTKVILFYKIVQNCHWKLELISVMHCLFCLFVVGPYFAQLCAQQWPWALLWSKFIIEDWTRAGYIQDKCLIFSFYLYINIFLLCDSSGIFIIPFHHLTLIFSFIIYFCAQISCHLGIISSFKRMIFI